ncbi:hypothetical protein GCM10027084_19050 [Pseudoxanthomonas sangjuensis]|uniref:hypothetical protein n=1 Tax=Pseudoxanthomonas sangjuensis TaxID=1503750 RepID=UPI001B87CAA0|nr:hypothetical protein [Pseudoxanthomonas sangjuensis]
MKRCALVACMAVLSVPACAPVQPVKPAAPAVSPQQRLSAVLAAAGGDDKELSVQPLRDPEVEDLRMRAAQAMSAHDYASSAEALNQALLIVADDPAVLQERAEVALVQGEYERAETLAQRAVGLGSEVGPLCRRHWETIRQVRQARLDEASAQPKVKDAAKQAGQVAFLAMQVAEATGKFESCTVPGVNRM